MINELSRLLSVNGFIPHGYCISWSVPLLTTYVLSDLLTFLAYFSMPVAIVHFARQRKDFPYRWLLWLFAGFITACGSTHLMGVVVLWQPMYGLDALLKAITAIVSIITAGVLWYLLPHALRLPSPAQLRQVNEALQQEILERKRIEEALRLAKEAAEASLQKEHRLMVAIVESSEDAIIGKTLDGRVTSWNQAAEKMFGYTAREIIGQSMQALVLPQRREAESSLLARITCGEMPCPFETEWVCQDGRVILVSVTLSPIRDEDGRIVGASTIARNISAQRATEQQLRKLSMAVEQSPISIVITNLDAEIEYVNAAFVRVSGYTQDEVLGQNPRVLHSGKTPEAAYEALWRALPAGEAWEGEFFNRRKDGREYVELARVSPIRQGDGRITHYLAIKEDITERRRMESTLVENEEKFRVIYDSINDGIFIHDGVSGRIVDVNRSACLMYGYGREALVSLDVADLSAGVAPYTAATVQAYIRQACQGARPAFEWLAQDSNGRQFWVAVNLETIHIQGAQRVMAVVRDIDRRKRAEQELQNSLREAHALNASLVEAQQQLLQSEKMASLGQLAAGVAHELNNPVGFVHSNLGTLDLYIKDIFEIVRAWERAAGLTKEPEIFAAIDALKQDKDFAFIKQDIFQMMSESREGLDRVRKIVLDLKSFSRVGDTQWQWADLHQGLDSTLNIVANEIKYHCTVRKEYGTLPPVMCVLSQLNQVFLNLIVNASHAIPEKGEISIATGQRGEEIFVAISDTGTGITPENLSRIFDPFFTTKAVGKGTGLGLSVSYSIVQKHRGRIEVHSTPGKGSTFTVWLPLKQPESVAVSS